NIEDQMFADRVKELRQKLGLTQDGLATLLREKHGLKGASQTTISRIESGARAPRLREARAIAQAFDTTIEAMISYQDIALLIDISTRGWEIGKTLAKLRREAQRVAGLRAVVAALQEEWERREYDIPSDIRNPAEQLVARSVPFIAADVHAIVQHGLDAGAMMTANDVDNLPDDGGAMLFKFRLNATRDKAEDVWLERPHAEHQETP
ncbi:MAG TPA: helix-turn-helix transcriptional regulator, partial [Humibacter sp.]|nr:helix-turn-helix transcriptional regulator [Humibacter sp.]